MLVGEVDLISFSFMIHQLLLLGVEVVIEDKLLWMKLICAVKFMMNVTKVGIHRHRITTSVPIGCARIAQHLCNTRLVCVTRKQRNALLKIHTMRI
jgi:hypothetical protein